MTETKVKIDAMARAHGEQTHMLPEDWDELLKAFKKKYGSNLPDNKLPGQSYYEAFMEKLQEGRLKPESLSQVVSAEEEDKFEKKRPESSRKFGIHLDSTLTAQTKRRYMSSMPRNVEELKAKYTVMKHMWLLAQIRQPGRQAFSDLGKDTWTDLLEELLNKDNFFFEKEIEGGGTLVGPDWNSCLEYEFQIRKQACILVREEGFGIQQALWAAYEDPQHRMKNWVQLLTEANAKQGSAADKFEKLQKRILELERSQQKAQKMMRLTNSTQQSCPTTAKGFPKGQKKEGNSKGQEHEPAWLRIYHPPSREKHFTENARSDKVCFKFQKHKCSDPSS